MQALGGCDEPETVLYYTAFGHGAFLVLERLIPIGFLLSFPALVYQAWLDWRMPGVDGFWEVWHTQGWFWKGYFLLAYGFAGLFFAFFVFALLFSYLPDVLGHRGAGPFHYNRPDAKTIRNFLQRPEFDLSLAFNSPCEEIEKVNEEKNSLMLKVACDGDDSNIDEVIAQFFLEQHAVQVRVKPAISGRGRWNRRIEVVAPVASNASQEA